MHPDIKPERYEYHNWDQASAEQSLLDAYRMCDKHAENAIEWYLTARQRKKMCARLLRFGVIVLTALAGIIPILSQLQLWTTNIEPGWATVALGIAGLFLGIDRYFGCSTAWMRFMVTEHIIRQQLHEFRINNEIDKADWESDGLSKEKIKTNLIRCREFLLQVDKSIRNETDQWVSEFQKTINQIDDSTKKK